MPNGGDGDYAARGTEPSGEAARQSRKPRASALEATAHRRTVGIMRDRPCGAGSTEGDKLVPTGKHESCVNRKNGDNSSAFVHGQSSE
jgi:hypothetical protein